MGRRKSGQKNSNSTVVKENGVSNGHLNGKAAKNKKPVEQPSVKNAQSLKAAKQINGYIPEKEKMEASERKRTTSASKSQQPLTLGEKRAATQPASSSSIDVRGESMAILLTQGLMANDASKIDAVLEKTNPAVIQATLADLKTADVLPLLRAIEVRLRTRKAFDIRPYIRWAQGCMSMHLSYLSSQPSLDVQLGGLLDWMRVRTFHMQKLLALHGKMTVLAEEMEKRRGGTSAASSQPAVPLIVFNDEEKSDDEMESISDDDVDRASSEEDDWWDDGGVAAPDAEDSEEEDDDEGDEDEDDSDDGGDDSEGGEEEEDDDEEGGGGGDSDEAMDV